ncbi:MAG: UxaA family hydrolase [Chloroflexi bacterium]|nr:UxaA family hydrolase [Chloroflexota bacterium]
MNLQQLSWQGYLRQDGRKGIRNLVLVIYTVECAKHVAHLIAADEPDTHVIGFPGCYDNQYAIRLMLALGCHPNVGAVLAVGLGCEYTRPDKIAEVVQQSGRPASWFTIQQAGGTAKSMVKGKAILAELRYQIAETAVCVPMTLADLVVGAECGGSDATSGIAGNPVVGAFYDLLVDQGGTAIFEEIVEMLGLKSIMLDRAATPDARTQLAVTYDKAEWYCKEVRQYSVAPGNFAGGLTTIEDKSMGAFIKGGSKPIQGVIKVGERPSHPGLWIMDSVPDPHYMQFGYTNPNDTEGIMDLISSGAQIILFITGRGSVIGAPIAPLIKITGNQKTYQHMEGDMDFDASRVLSGEMSMEAATIALLEKIVHIAKGEASKSERLGHREYFVMYKHQSTTTLVDGCRQ